MKKGEILEGIVERVDFPNKGAVRTREENGEDAVCIVKNVLPGQKVSFCVQKKRGGKAEGRLLEVLERAENEVESPCPHFGLCGGCLYHNLSYEEQCGLKQEQVKRLLDPVLGGKGEWLFEEIRQSPVPYGYRNKMEFTFGDEVKEGPLSVGLHKRGGFYDIITVSDCRIMDGDYRRILTATREYFAGQELPFFHRLKHTGFLRHLLVRKGAKTGEILVALVTTSGMDSVAGAREVSGKGDESVPDMSGFAEMLLKLSLEGKIVGILHMVNDSVADVVRSDETRILYGRDYFYEELLGLRFRISAFSFFQTNSLGAEVLYSTAREFVGDLYDGDSAKGAEKTEEGKAGEEKRDRVVDLYSGTGTIAQLMAPMAKKVVGVEIVEEAVDAARENAALNGLDNCEFIAGDVLKVLDELEEKPDLIILDPPRDGVHPKALGKILAYGVERIVYISCKPTSLARDLVRFLEEGYRAERVVCCDMFPWTGNVETVVLLTKLHTKQMEG